MIHPGYADKRILILLFVLLTFIPLHLLSNDYGNGEIRYFDNFELPITATALNEEESDPAQETAVDNPYDAILQKVIDEGRITNTLDSSAFLSLPLGVAYGEDHSYMIVIDKATIYPGYAEFSAFMVLTNPLDDSKIRFRANNIGFSFKQGLVNGVQLELIDKKKVKIQEDAAMWFLPGSYVDWDCNGFKSLGINGELELSQKRFVKVDPLSGEEQGKVSTFFSIVASDFQNILLEISLDPFKMKGFNEAYFAFESMVLDFSDDANAPGFSLPANYPGGYSGEMTNLWRGFFVKEARVYLSKKFADKGGQPTSFYAQNMLLDDYGLTGLVGADNLLSIEKGKIGSWPMSIDNFAMEFFTGELKALGLKGKLIMQGSDSPLQYDAFYDAAGAYHFGINPGKELSFNAFAAKITLDGSSRIEVSVEQNKFYPTAELNGQISFACSKDTTQNSKKLVNLPSLKFQGLRISTLDPRFDLDFLGMASGDDLSFNNFPVTLTEASFRKNGTSEAVFIFGIKVNLVPAQDDAIVGETRIGLIADISGDKWRFDGLSVEKIAIEAKKEGAYDLKGLILFAKGDPVYGDGFRGEIAAKFANTFELDALAVFGKVEGFRYFFVDAFMTFGKTGIPAGPFIVNGFGGGIYYHMHQAIPGETSGEMGQSLSGLSYIPDKSSFIGLKAGVQAGVINPAIVTCKVNFEIIFNQSGGINQIGFNGEATVVSPVKELPADEMKEITEKAAAKEPQKVESSEVMKATISILMDFQNDVFHSEMELFINVAGAITGIGPNNRAGWGVMHIDPEKWYLHMGTPTDPMGLDLVGIVKVGGYFMAGHDIPDAMMMHPKVLEYLDMDNADFNGNRKEGVLNKGQGLAFGANFELDTGDLKFLIFYARFELGGGFDVMLLKHPNNAYCAGRDGGIGINQWYGKGQAYAYFGGKIGIKVRVFRRKRKFDIINLQTAAAIRIEGPNPTWMKGVVGGKYRILGGLVKGKCKFEMTVGEKCEMAYGRDLSDLEIIADLTPGNTAQDVDIFTLPQAVFNMPINKIIRISEDERLTKVFKVNLEEYSVYKGDTPFIGTTEMGSEKKTLAFTPERIFDPNSKYRIIARVSFDEYEKGQWQKYKSESGDIYYETKEVEFTTGALPDRIPTDYIQYTYPLNRQVNFYKQEYSTAYVTFKSDLEPFFMPPVGWSQKARWTPASGAPIYSDIIYKPGEKTAETAVPSELANGSVHHFELVNVPIDKNNDIKRNIKTNTSETINDAGGTTSEITTMEAVGEIREVEEKTFYAIPFRVSSYNTFAQNFTVRNQEIEYMHTVSPGVRLPFISVNIGTGLDKHELIGSDNIEPLVQTEAVLESSDWYQANIAPIIYDNYPVHPSAKITYRPLHKLGVPPVRGINLNQMDYDLLLTDTDIENGSYNSLISHINVVYTLPKHWSTDYAHIRSKLAELYRKGQYYPNVQMKSIFTNKFCPQASVGNYPVKLKYVLPGKKTVTSEFIVNFKNNFDWKQISEKDERF